MSITQEVSSRPQYAPGWLVGQLPVGMRDDEMLVRFATIFERLGETLREGADTVEHVADPTVTTPAMLAYMGRWLGYDLLDPHLPAARQRQIVAALGRALPMRGTAVGLRTILEAVTDGPVDVSESGCVLNADQEQPTAQGIVVTVRSTGHLREHELRALVADEVPAHLPVDLVIVDTSKGAP
ncbi:MAG: phage tail-like protein [Glaciecola sp.]|jgi:phage tail-like protein